MNRGKLDRLSISVTFSQSCYTPAAIQSVFSVKNYCPGSIFIFLSIDCHQSSSSISRVRKQSWQFVHTLYFPLIFYACIHRHPCEEERVHEYDTKAKSRGSDYNLVHCSLFCLWSLFFGPCIIGEEKAVGKLSKDFCDLLCCS